MSPNCARNMKTKVLIAMSAMTMAASFQVGSVPALQQRTMLPGALTIHSSQAETATDASTVTATKSKTATLKLQGKTQITSKEFPLESIKMEQIQEFLDDDDTIQLLLSGGKDLPIYPQPTSDDLLKMWQSECEESGATAPTDADVIYNVTTSGVDFPGLHLKSTANIGAKIIPNADNGLVSYEFTMINDESSVSGLPPVVWVYNKLSGANKQSADADADDEGEGQTKTMSLNRFQPIIEDDKIRFESDVELVVSINFPAFLLRILPTNKEKAEESGGASIQKVLDRDLGKALTAFEEHFASKFASSH